MEAAAVGVTAATARGGSIPMSSSQSHRKEWRMVSEQQVQNAGNEGLERSKLGQSDERTIYEVQQGREPLDEIDFCSIQMDRIGGLDDEIVRQRVHTVARKREELQQLEIELRAQIVAKSEILEIRNSVDAQIKEQANVVNKLQEQLYERDQTLSELERKMEEKERELHAIRLDNEAAWAKEDLLREQNKELANFRRERDTIEAERAHHIKQIHDLQEHIQDKDRQLMELQEQNRIAQEAIIYKDEQIREAQSWITRVQEMDALQSSTNHSLQAELRERTEQYNQLWLLCQRQFADMERLHMQTQQLQLELAAARDKSIPYNDEAHGSKTNSNDVLHFEQKTGSHHDATGGGAPTGDSGGHLANGNSDKSFLSSDNASNEPDHSHGVQVTPASLLGMPSYVPSGPMTALHPYVMHQQGPSHSVPSHVAQSHVGFHSVPGMSVLQHWQNQQAGSEGQQMSKQNQYQQPQENLSRSESTYGYDISVNGPGSHSDYLNIDGGQGRELNSAISSAETQAHHAIDNNYIAVSQDQQSLQQISSQFQDALRIEPLGEMKSQENNTIELTNEGLKEQGVNIEQASFVASPSPSETSTHAVFLTEAPMNNASDAVIPEAFVTAGQISSQPTGKGLEVALLDERSLLTCIVRTIPAGGKIRISSTLPNRLAKMLSPLHWHDYKKKYGKLDDFVTSHPDLFVIEGDYIQLREGAQGIIAATAAVAKVAAAAASSSPYSSFFPSVAVTPVVQANRPKKVTSMESKSIRNAADISLQASVMHNHLPDGAGFKNLSKTQDPVELDGPDIMKPFENGTHSDRASVNSQSEGSYNSRLGANYSTRQGRTTAAQLASRR